MGSGLAVFRATETNQYLKWKDANLNVGYVGAFRWNAYGRLHCAWCPYIDKPTQKTDAVRACSTDRLAVEKWAKENQRASLIPCGHCLRENSKEQKARKP